MIRVNVNNKYFILAPLYMAAYLPELARRQVDERVRPDLLGQSFRSNQAGLFRQVTRVSDVVGKAATSRFPSHAAVPGQGTSCGFHRGIRSKICYSEPCGVAVGAVVVGFKRHDWSSRRRAAPGERVGVVVTSSRCRWTHACLLSTFPWVEPGR